MLNTELNGRQRKQERVRRFLYPLFVKHRRMEIPLHVSYVYWATRNLTVFSQSRDRLARDISSVGSPRYNKLVCARVAYFL